MASANVLPLSPSLSRDAWNGDISLLELAAVYLYLKEMKINIFERGFCRGRGGSSKLGEEYFVLQANLRLECIFFLYIFGPFLDIFLQV